VCTTGDTAHIDTIFKFLPHTRQHGCIDNLHCCNDSVNCSHHGRMIFSAGGFYAYFARNARCTVTTDLLVSYSNTQNDFSPRAAIFSVHILESPSGRNVNYDEKQLSWIFFSVFSFYLYRFRKYLSYGFLIINFVISEYITKHPLYVSEALMSVVMHFCTTEGFIVSFTVRPS
jgi:hypothetical protein